MATDLNTLKNWFKTGLKPTQKQFWAWLDSFWHKNDKIPQSQIEGLDKSLENKAETSDLNTKANADATGLGDDNIISWKKALGVGEIPKNMAKIDTDSEQGNVHTKEQIAELLKNSGKNLGNTDLVIPAGTVRTVDVTDAKLQFKGLSMVGNDASFNLKPKFNAQGELKLTEEVEVKLNFPENLNIAVTNTFVQPNPVGTPATYTEEIKAVMDQIPTLTLTPILGSDLTLKVFEDRVLPADSPVKISPSGEVFLVSGNTEVLKGVPYTQESVSAYSNVRLPSNKNWILKVIGSFTDGGRGENYVEIGLARTTPENPIFYGLQNGSYNTYQIKGSNPVQRIPRGTDGSYTMYILKTGGVVTVVLYSNGECKVYSFNAFEELGDYIPKARLNGYAYYHNTFKMSYKILT